MKRLNKIVSIAFAALPLFALSACGAAGKTAETAAQEVQESSLSEESEMVSTETEATSSGKILVAYFSATGNTRPIAEAIAKLAGADLFEIVPADPYTEEDLNYNNDSCRANREQNDSTARPEISDTVENMDQYDTVLIGHPIWWGEEPRIMDTFMESYDFSGKTVTDFCTSGGSGISKATENLKALSPDADWLEGNRFETSADEETIQAWLDELSLSGL